VRKENAVPVTKERIQELMRSQQHHEGDTGSSEVQIALLTERIRNLTEHLQSHPKDHATRRGLFKLIGQRRRLLNYLERTNIESYRKILGELELRR
jgi:small subunit ribosomal protein S15